jgi:hypothetical protein
VRIQRPQGAEGLSHRFATPHIPIGAELELEDGDRALFVQHGRVLGVLETGCHRLDPAELAFLSWAARPGSTDLDCELHFLRAEGTVDVEGDVEPTTLQGYVAHVEAVLAVQVVDTTLAVQALVRGRSLDELLDEQFWRGLPGLFDRAAAGRWPEDLDQLAEQVANLAVRDGMGFAQFGARLVELVELHIHEGDDSAEAAGAPAGFAPGAPVLAQSNDGRWSEGTIVQMQAGRIEIAWNDGRRAWVTPYQVRPL